MSLEQGLLQLSGSEAVLTNLKQSRKQGEMAFCSCKVSWGVALDIFSSGICTMSDRAHLSAHKSLLISAQHRLQPKSDPNGVQLDEEYKLCTDLSKIMTTAS